MRNISPTGLAKITSRYGAEPINIVEIDWADTEVSGTTPTYLVGDISATAATITVASSAGFNATRNFYIALDVEIMLCTQVNGTTLSVVRGVKGTVPVMHYDQTEVTEYGGSLTFQYADRDIPGPPFILGRIIDIGQIDDAINIDDRNNQTKEVSVTLDDTDGSIKTILDNHDVHNRPIRVYQWFNGLQPGDMFLVFSGRINTPITWTEHDRTVKITGLSHIEDQEAGFSVEEGLYNYIPSSMVGKPWPQIFGLVYDYPALELDLMVQGETMTGIGILTGEGAFLSAPLYANGSSTDYKKLAQIAGQEVHMDFLSQAAFAWDFSSMPDGHAKAAAYNKQQLDILNQILQEKFQMARSEQCIRSRRSYQAEVATELMQYPNPVQILGGEDFPQNVNVTLLIKGCLISGKFQGQSFYVNSATDPQAQAEIESQIYNGIVSQHISNGLCPPLAEPHSQYFDYKTQVPCNGSADSALCPLEMQGFIFWPAIPAIVPPNAEMKQTWIDPGTKVYLYDTPTVTYIASTTPGTVLSVKAFRSENGERTLLTVDPSMYTVSTVQIGSVMATQIVLNQRLSNIWFIDRLGNYVKGWSDEIYVSFQSTVGPNIVDILKYIITTYTDLAYDPVSFAAVRNYLAPFPANFPLLERKNVLALLQEITFQARCAFWVEDEIIFLKYLPIQPAPVDSIAVSDIDSEHSVIVELTETENLVTKMNVKWHYGYILPTDLPNLPSQEVQYMVLRHNVGRYGLHERDYDWYIFNQPDIILKMATFWLIRLSTAWKRVKFRTYLNKLNLQAFDCVTFNAPGYVANTAVPVIVERAAYNSAENGIDFDCIAPVRPGTMVQDQYFWPSSLPPSIKWPPQDDINSGDAGNGGSNSLGNLWSGLPVDLNTAGWQDSQLVTAIRQIPVSTLPTLGSVVVVGGVNTAFVGHADWGDATPGDVGFTAQPVPVPGATSNNAPTSPGFFQIEYLPESAPMKVAPDPAPPISIDMGKTVFYDSTSPTPQAGGVLKSLLAIGNGGAIQIDLNRAGVQDSSQASPAANAGPAQGYPLKTVLQITTGAGASGSASGSPVLGINGTVPFITTDAPQGAPFDFKYDTTGKKLGAGTAFLQAGSSGSGP
jgi:hypothetical protein